MSFASSITTKISASWAKRSEARRRRNELCETVLTETRAVWRFYERGPWKAWEPTGSAMTQAMTRADQAGFKLVRIEPALEPTLRPLLACSDAMLQERMAGGRRVSADLVRDHKAGSKAFAAAARTGQ